MKSDEIRNLRQICYELSGHVNRRFGGPDNVDPAQQKHYDRYQQMIQEVLEALHKQEAPDDPRDVLYRFVICRACGYGANDGYTRDPEFHLHCEQALAGKPGLLLVTCPRCGFAWRMKTAEEKDREETPDEN